MTWRVGLQVHDSLVLRHTTRNEPLINADYRSLELTIMADLCLRLFNDRQLADMVAPGAPDLHAVNAKMVFGLLGRKHPDGRWIRDIPVTEFKTDAHCIALRHMIKTIIFGYAYGKRGYGFSTLEGADGQPIGEEVGDELVEALTEWIPGFKKWESWAMAFVDAYHGIYSLDGRWCDLADESADDAPDWLRRRGYRRAMNYPLQASGAGIIGDAMVIIGRCRELADPRTSVERACHLVNRHMVAATANGTKLIVPLQVEIGIGDDYYAASH